MQTELPRNSAYFAGQLHMLGMRVRDAVLADMRPILHDPKEVSRLCRHPYDLCTELIARKVGVIVTDAHGGALTALLDTTSNVSWGGYANEALCRSIEPVLQQLLQARRYALLMPDTLSGIYRSR